LRSQEIDQIARSRCLMVLSVLSGETPVTDAIAQAGISRPSYYQLETRALNGMLKALGPHPSPEAAERSPVRQIAALEEKVKELEQARRRTQRLLLMTRRVIRAPETKTSSTRRGRGPSPASRTKRQPQGRPSTPETTGEGAP
jgi:hypothetical protein